MAIGARPNRVMRLSGSGAFGYSEGDRYRSQRSVAASLIISYQRIAQSHQSLHLSAHISSSCPFRTHDNVVGSGQSEIGAPLTGSPPALPSELLPFFSSHPPSPLALDFIIHISPQGSILRHGMVRSPLILSADIARSRACVVTSI